MPKFLVETVQVVTQRVYFQVEAETPEEAQQHVEGLCSSLNPGTADIVDYGDEDYLQNIVVSVSGPQDDCSQDAAVSTPTSEAEVTQSDLHDGVTG